MSTGYSNKQVAAELKVSTNTVGTRARSIFTKLGVRSRSHLSNQYHHQIVATHTNTPDLRTAPTTT